ncbi:MAG: GatB/YqeY domain-containing protein [Candidatus Moranbacteria bacterium]|nr:GatB/YqeY domain-containing protein [Candidatus Moranbacteria bacterium]
MMKRLMIIVDLMSLYQTVADHVKEAMKQGDILRRDTLRMLQSAIKNVAIEKRVRPEEFTDAQVEEVIRRLVKQRKDSIEQYTTGGRTDLVEKESAELNLLSTYLPQAMPEEELRSLVAGVLNETGISAKAEMGQAMGAVMKKVSGRASGDDVRKVVESLLK